GEDEAGGVVGQTTDQSEVDQLADAVGDVEPHAAEGRHQRLEVEALVRARREPAQQSRAQRRLDKRLESRLDACVRAAGLRQVLHVRLYRPVCRIGTDRV